MSCHTYEWVMWGVDEWVYIMPRIRLSHVMQHMCHITSCSKTGFYMTLCSGCYMTLCDITWVLHDVVLHNVPRMWLSHVMQHMWHIVCVCCSVVIAEWRSHVTFERVMRINSVTSTFTQTICYKTEFCLKLRYGVLHDVVWHNVGVTWRCVT